MKKIAVIYGSSRPSKVGKQVADWFVNEAEPNKDFEFIMIDLAELNLPILSEPIPPIAAQYSQQSTIDWGKTIADMDAVIFVVAEYNLGYTAILKNAIDTLFHEWNEKPGAVISYGAFPESSAAAQLRTVLGVFKMKLAEKTLHVKQISDAISEDGTIDDSHVTGDLPQDIIGAVTNALGVQS